jgi:uncharacterized membrane protein YfcA
LTLRRRRQIEGGAVRPVAERRMLDTNLILVVLALLAGGVLKGATGAGAPVLAVPLMAILFDVPFAVTVMAVPNICTNAVQGWRFRRHVVSRPFMALFAASGAAGVLLGSWLLSRLPQSALSLMVALAVLGYIGFRLLRADWRLPYGRALRLAGPLGVVAGMLQGASGLSAPVSLSFMNAMRLERPVFIGTISIFFLSISAPQLPALWALGLMDGHRFLLSAAALLPLLAGMPLGNRAARYVSRQTFDRIILALLAAIAVKILLDAFVAAFG